LTGPRLSANGDGEPRFFKYREYGPERLANRMMFAQHARCRGLSERCRSQ
jgi:hypothetical protein